MLIPEKINCPICNREIKRIDRKFYFSLMNDSMYRCSNCNINITITTYGDEHIDKDKII